jgi:hypothetical protein
MSIGAPNVIGLFLLLALVALVALPALFRVLWNSTMPELFGLKAMTYAQWSGSCSG